MAFNNQETHFKLTYLRAVNIPPEKTGHWYSVLLTQDIPSVGQFTLDLSRKDQSLHFFISKPSATIDVNLFAKHKMRIWRSDELIAQGVMQIDSLAVGETQGILARCAIACPYHTITINAVILTPTTDYNKKNPMNPTLIFNIAVIITRADLTRVHVDPALLEVNPSLTKAIDGIRCLVNVGLAFSELNPIARMVMSLLNLDVTQLDNLLKHDESVLLLVEELNQVNVLVMNWDNLSHVEHQPHRERVCRELLPQIYKCLNLLQQLSQENTLSVESIKEVDNHRKKLGELVKLLKSNQQLDTQTAVLKINKSVSTMHNMFSKSNNNQIKNSQFLMAGRDYINIQHDSIHNSK
ncbi:hypothetical protein H0H92_005963 [Tricholoma furcatifolium]|nr:hypothetical protein H0H92_005963 [Tricholoma furcatifolium]